MAEGLQTADGKRLDLEAAQQTFEHAMAAPEGEVPAPPRATVEQKEKARAPRATSRARSTSKADKARIAASEPQRVDKDFTEDLQGITTGLWLTAASIPPTQAYAALIKLNQPALVASLNQGAQNNATIRGYVSKLGSGGGGLWMVSLGVTTANMAMQAMQIMRDPKLRGELAAQTQAELRAYLESQGIRTPEPDARTDTSEGKHSGPRGWLTVLAGWRAGTGDGCRFCWPAERVVLLT